jgi:hypothetical protein
MFELIVGSVLPHLALGFTVVVAGCSLVIASAMSRSSALAAVRATRGSVRVSKT